MTQIRSSNTWIVIIYLRLNLPLCILLILTLLHINQGMLTCKTVRTNYSRQNDWSQGFRLCDQEELPCWATYVKVPCQGHIRYSECGSTSAVPAAQYCWVQMCLHMSYVFILQYYLRHHAAIHQVHAIQGWVQTSSTQIPQDVSYIYHWGSLIHKIPWKTGLTYESLCGKYMLSMLKTKYDQPKFCLMATQVVLLQKQFSSEIKEIIWQ